MEKYWVAPTGAVFDSSNNWSLTSGGTPGADVPNGADVAIFDASGQGSCLFDATIDILGLRITSDYSGVLLQQNDPIFIGTSDASFDGGVFSGSFADITIYGDLFIGSTNFINTSGTLTLYGEFRFNPSLTPITVEDFVIEEYTLTDFDATAKYLVLEQFPREPTAVALNIVEGVAQIYGSDYDVYGMSVRWNGRDLDGYLATGDQVRIKYPPDDVPGKFFHNFGEFRAMTTGSHFYPNGVTFWDLRIDNDSTPVGYRYFDTTSYVQNRLLLDTGYTRDAADGTVHARGDIYNLPNFGQWNMNHNMTVYIDASGPQNIFTTGGILPNIWVDKTTTSQVRLFGDSPMYINGDLMINDGTFNTNGINVNVGVA